MDAGVPASKEGHTTVTVDANGIEGTTSMVRMLLPPLMARVAKYEVMVNLPAVFSWVDAE